MEYLHNEAADSLSVLILVKTKLETPIEHRLAWADSIGKQRESGKKKKCSLENIGFAETLLNINKYQCPRQGEKMNFWRITLVQKLAWDHLMSKDTYITNGVLMIQPLPLLKEESFVPVSWHQP